MYKEEGKIITFQIQTQKPETNKKKKGVHRNGLMLLYMQVKMLLLFGGHILHCFFFNLIFVLLLSREKLEVGY